MPFKSIYMHLFYKTVKYYYNELFLQCSDNISTKTSLKEEISCLNDTKYMGNGHGVLVLNLMISHKIDF